MYFIVTDLHLVSMCKTLKSKVKSVGLKEHWGQKLNSCSKQVSVVGKIVFSLSQYWTQFDSEFRLFPIPNYL